MAEIIHTDRGPAALGPYSQALKAGNLVFVSGQIGLDPATGALVPGDVVAQTTQVCTNLAAILEAAGSSCARALKTTCFLADLADFAAFNAEYAKFFTGCPARECVQVAALPKGALVEVSVIAEA